MNFMFSVIVGNEAQTKISGKYFMTIILGFITILRMSKNFFSTTSMTAVSFLSRAQRLKNVSKEVNNDD